MPQLVKYPSVYDNDPKVISAIIKCIRNIKSNDKIRYVSIPHWHPHYRKENYDRVYTDPFEFFINKYQSLVYFDAIAVNPFQGFKDSITLKINPDLIKGNYIKAVLGSNGYYYFPGYFTDHFYPIIIFKK